MTELQDASYVTPLEERSIELKQAQIEIEQLKRTNETLRNDTRHLVAVNDELRQQVSQLTLRVAEMQREELRRKAEHEMSMMAEELRSSALISANRRAESAKARLEKLEPIAENAMLILMLDTYQKDHNLPDSATEELRTFAYARLREACAAVTEILKRP